MIYHLKRVLKKKLHRPENVDPKDYSATLGVGSVVPCQIEAYFLALKKYVKPGYKVIDVGFGLGYGINILSIVADELYGVDVDVKSLEYCTNTIVNRNPKLKNLQVYDGYNIKYPDSFFDIVTCVDVIEHVDEYHRLIDEMLRISKKGVFISTPNRIPENTKKNGKPKNHWHLREWSFEEIDHIIKAHSRKIEWNFLNGRWNGPYALTNEITENTYTLSPFIHK